MFIKKKFLLTIFFAILILTLGGCTLFQDKAGEARDAYENYEYSKAYSLFQDAINENPEDINLYIEASAILELKNDNENLLKLWRKAVDNTKSEIAYENYAEALLNDGQIDKAIENFDKALNLNSNFQLAILGKSEALAKSSRFDDLRQFMSERKDLLDDFEVQLIKGFLFYEQPDKSIEFITNSESRVEENQRERYEEIVSLLEEGKKDESQLLYDMNLVWVILTEGKPAFARPIINDVVKSNEYYSQAYLYKGIMHYKLKEIDKAEEALLTAQELDKDNINTLEYLAFVYVEKDSFSQAEDQIDKALDITEEKSRVLDSFITKLELENYYDKSYEKKLEVYQLSKDLSDGMAYLLHSCLKQSQEDNKSIIENIRNKSLDKSMKDKLDALSMCLGSQSYKEGRVSEWQETYKSDPLYFYIDYINGNDKMKDKVIDLDLDGIYTYYISNK